jgi:acetyl esterase/lipase
MGSSYFYLEFLIAWISLLQTSGFRNPAIFSLEYTLVPDKSYPVQLHQALAGYRHVLSITRDPSKICVSGDSAGATLILSLLLYLSHEDKGRFAISPSELKMPAPHLAVLISPWTTLVSRQDKNTASDYLDANNLHHYAHQYASNRISIHDPRISPGNCKDSSWWREASPLEGFYICYGAEEVFAPETSGLISLLKKSGVKVRSREEKGGIHAWPVAALFLSSTREERQKGLKTIVTEIRESIKST